MNKINLIIILFSFVNNTFAMDLHLKDQGDGDKPLDHEQDDIINLLLDSQMHEDIDQQEFALVLDEILGNGGHNMGDALVVPVKPPQEDNFHKMFLGPFYELAKGADVNLRDEIVNEVKELFGNADQELVALEKALSIQKSLLPSLHRLYLISAVVLLKNKLIGYSGHYQYLFPLRLPNANKDKVKTLIKNTRYLHMGLKAANEHIVRAYNNIVRKSKSTEFENFRDMIDQITKQQEFSNPFMALSKVFTDYQYELLKDQEDARNAAPLIPVLIPVPQYPQRNFIAPPQNPVAQKLMPLPQALPGKNVIVVRGDVKNLHQHNGDADQKRKRALDIAAEKRPGGFNQDGNPAPAKILRKAIIRGKNALRNDQGLFVFGNPANAKPANAYVRAQLSEIFKSLASLKTHLTDFNYNVAFDTLRVFETFICESRQVCEDLVNKFAECRRNFMQYSFDPRLVVHIEQDDAHMEDRAPACFETLNQAYNIALNNDRLVDFFTNAFAEVGENTVCVEGAQKLLINWMESELDRVKRPDHKNQGQKPNQEVIMKELVRAIQEIKALPCDLFEKNLSFDAYIEQISSNKTLCDKEKSSLRLRAECDFANKFKTKVISDVTSILLQKGYVVSFDEIQKVVDEFELI